MFMHDHENTGLRDAINYQIECKNLGVLNDPTSIECISVEKCDKCKKNQFETESCKNLPVMSGHISFLLVNNLLI